jgi:hypothetical protein
MHKIEADIAQSPQQRTLLFNFRYQHYVGECGLFREIADNSNMTFAEPADDLGVNFYAADRGKIVGSARLNRADDPGLERYMELSGVENFMRNESDDSILINRLIAKQRALFPLIEALTRYVDQAGVRCVLAGGAIPDVSGMYRSVGFEMHIPGLPVAGFGACDVYRLDIAAARESNGWFRSFSKGPSNVPASTFLRAASV